MKTVCINSQNFCIYALDLSIKLIQQLQAIQLTIHSSLVSKFLQALTSYNTSMMCLDFLSV